MAQLFSTILAEWTSHHHQLGIFSILGMVGGIFHFHSKFNINFCKQAVKTVISRLILSVYCLLMPHENDTRPVWVANFIYYTHYHIFTSRMENKGLKTVFVLNSTENEISTTHTN